MVCIELCLTYSLLNLIDIYGFRIACDFDDHCHRTVNVSVSVSVIIVIVVIVIVIVIIIIIIISLLLL